MSPIPLQRPEAEAHRNALRLLGMVHELHKQGWQRLRIRASLSGSGFHWRCAIHPKDIDRTLLDEVDEGTGPFTTVARYTTAAERDYFQWGDCAKDDARQLAAKFLLRFPHLCAQAQGRDWAYAGWYAELLGHTEHGRLPLWEWDTNGHEASYAKMISAVWIDDHPFPFPPPEGKEDQHRPT